MKAKYIIRLDDASPTMDREKWSAIENLLDEYNIKPIVAVIPENKDPNMLKDPFDPNFWERVSAWQNKGWHIALHGFDHVYITQESGLVPFNKRSEFAGLSLLEQAEKIKKGIDIFKEHHLDTGIWVAPSHTFDKNTLTALEQESEINIISDGIAIFPYREGNFIWLPQQFWKFRKMPFGLWTACFHPNEIKETELKDLKNFICNHYQSFENINVVKKTLNSKGFINKVFEHLYWFLRKLRAIKWKKN